MNSNKKKNLRNKISNLVKEYSDLEFKRKKFIPGKTTIPPTGKIIGDFCDANYECLSRCCSRDKCTNFIYCALTC